MNKDDFKEMIHMAGVKQWQIAEKLGIREDALSRKLRHELTPEDEKSIKEVIQMISQGKELKINASDQTE